MPITTESHRSSRTISCALASAPASATGVPVGGIEGSTDRDDLGAAMAALARLRIVLSGTIAEGDYRLLVDLRRDAIGAAKLLRSVARSGGMFPAEYLAGAADALRAARTIGRAHVDLSRFERQSGGQYGFGWPVLERDLVARLRRAKADLDRAYEKAYTGTHY